MQYAFASIVQARPLPDFGRPLHPFRLQPGTAPQALRIRPHERHPALRTTRRAAHEALPPCLDIAPCIRAPVGLGPTRLSRCPAHTIFVRLVPRYPPVGGNRPALPCSQGILWLHAVGTNPGSFRTPLANTVSGMLPSPFGGQIGNFDSRDFGANVLFT